MTGHAINCEFMLTAQCSGNLHYFYRETLRQSRSD